MKRVSFKVAKALKEAGYKLTPAPSSFFTNDTNSFWDETDEELYSFPYVIEVWLWLWEKEICIEIKNNHYYTLAKVNNERFRADTPEEVIAKAIEYLVDNKLLK